MPRTVHPAQRRVQLSAEGIAALTAAAGRATGLPTTGARLLKFTNNAVVLLPRAGAVLRIAGSNEVRARVPVVVAAARWLQGLGLPAVRLHPQAPNPLAIGGHLVTVWQAVQTAAAPATASGLAEILRVLHAVGAPPPPDLPDWNVVAAIRRRLGEADGVAEGDLAFLREELAAVEAMVAALQEVEPLVPSGVVHGDAFLGNVIASPGGPVICDFDGVSVGPREWDLVPVAVGALRFDYGTGLQAEFARAYGVDVTAWPGFPALRRVRELQLVTSVLPVLEANPALRPQWRVRLETLRRRDSSVRWTPYPAADHWPADHRSADHGPAGEGRA
ncbi:MAG TPA: aminoglycoside phosphotransferase family protein [Kineosporiaceae bacterium]|nr:aminoglycoside phosphotransferase family protein [Kineosporiaceae bacterium]